MKMHRNGDIQRKYIFLDGFNYLIIFFYNRIIQQNNFCPMVQAYKVMVFLWAIFHFEALFSF